ncbi:MAG: hypothetical protein JW913_13355 [Chitinispirillaceae bacterium]|nr:hypothetical protein [Chitinispirillaceae bacterium]
MKSTCIFSSVLISACILAAFMCTNQPTAGNSSQTPNAVVGMIYKSDGKTPAAGVKVAIRLRKTLADISGSGLVKKLADTATVFTDDYGNFTFDSTLDTGLYVVEADDGNGNMALIDSVKVGDTDSTVHIEDTLRPAGAITGVVYLSEGGDPRKVFILAMGLDRFTGPDSTGRFTFGNMAEAIYDLTLISSLDDYAVLEVPEVEVVAGNTRDVDTLMLQFTGIPVPRWLKFSYDTLKQIVTLMWNQADTTMISGYHVYRRNVDSNSVATIPINKHPIIDTLYCDSTGIQGQTYEYRVAAVDENAMEGTKSTGVSIRITAAIQLVMIWDSSVINSNNGANSIIKDTKQNYLVGLWHEGVAVFDSTGTFIKTILQDPDIGSCYPRDVDMQGNIYVQNQYARGHSIVILNPDYERIKTISNTDFDTAIFSDFNDLQIDNAGNIIVVNSDTILVIDTAGNVKKKVTDVVGSPVERLRGPRGVLVDKNDNLWIADALNRRVVVVDTAFQILKEIAFESIMPAYLAIDGDLLYMVCFTESDKRIFVYDLVNEEIRTTIDGSQTPYKKFYSAHRFLVESGTIYYPDTYLYLFL